MHATPNRFFSFQFSLLLSLGLGTIAAQAQEPDSDPASQDDIAQINKEVSILKSLRSTIDRSQFELDAAVDRLEWSVDEVIEFVRNEIAFEQYPGVLRGAQGTLMSRSGNSLDQALLLATLIKETGADARIARGNLSREQSEELLEQMGTPREPPPSPVNVAKWNEISGEAEIIQSDAESSRGERSPDIDIALEAAGLLKREIQKHADGQLLGSEPDELIREASDYFWVEYRESAAGSWIAVHPAFDEQSWGADAVEAITYYSDEIPTELSHKVRIAVFVERSELGDLKLTQIVPDYERPVANMLGRSFVFLNVPNQFNDNLLDSDVTQLRDSSEMFIPLFAGQVLPGSQGFDLDGVPYDLDLLADGVGATALFRTVGDRIDSATGALHGLGSDGPTDSRARYLTAQWIEYTLIAPDGKERTARRYLLDRVGPAAREAGKVEEASLERAEPWQVYASEEFMLAAGAYPDSVTLDVFLSRRLGGSELLHTYGTTGDLSMGDFTKVPGSESGANATVLLSLLQDFDNGIAEQLNAATYRSGPTLLALHWSPVSRDRMRFSTDIVSNERRSRAWRDQDVAQRDIILHGVWETVAESHALEMLNISALHVETPLASLSGEDESTPIRMLSDGEQLASLEISDSQRRKLRAELDSGYWVATRSHANADDLSWWRIDPASGSVIGMLSDGRGATATEYLIGLGGISMAFLGVLYIHSLGECTLEDMTAPQGSTKRGLECCLIDQFTPDGSHAETVAFKWAMATDTLKRQVGMDVKLCRGH